MGLNKLERSLQMRKTHLDAKKQVPKEVIKKVESEKDMIKAAKYILRQDTIKACAILDMLWGVQSAILLGVFISVFRKNVRSKKLLRRARYLKIRGTKGLGYERNKYYRETGCLLI
ncbi:hypothetical protein KW783_02890 [Candidatus Parcubacteria bacterium]|nr:hypothetical protein [Candidatus Parcubacteria bacterium]